MSKFSKLIDDLESLHEQDIKNAAQVFGVSATLSVRLQQILESLEVSTISPNLLPEATMTKEELIQRYGNLNKAYNAYKEAYGIKCHKLSWDNFLQVIQGLNAPENKTNLEERVAKLEETVKLLVQVLVHSET